MTITVTEVSTFYQQLNNQSWIKRKQKLTCSESSLMTSRYANKETSMNPLFLFLCWWWWWWWWWWYWKWQAMNSTASWWFLAEDWRDSWRCISFIIVFWCIKIHDPLNTGSWGGPIPINPFMLSFSSSEKYISLAQAFITKHTFFSFLHQNTMFLCLGNNSDGIP